MIGVVTLTGVGFKVSFIVTSAAQTIAAFVNPLLPAGLFGVNSVMLFAALLLVTKGFTWSEFFVAFSGCALGIVALSAALSKFFLVGMRLWERWLAVFAAVLLIAPGLASTLIGVVLVAPIVLRHVLALRAGAPAAAG